MTAGDKIRGVVAAAVIVALDVVQREFGPILDSAPAITTGEAVAEIDGQTLFLAYPIHSLSAIGVAVAWCVFHIESGLMMFPCWPGAECVGPKGNTSLLGW
jgi:hypothetical protein